MPTVPCHLCPLRRRELFVLFTPEELRFMERFKVGELAVAPGATILMEGSNSPQLYTVLLGQGVRYKTLPDGRRQVIDFLFPGDFTGLQAGLMGEIRHSVEAATAMTLCVFERSQLWALFRASPYRAYDLTWIAAVEEHVLGETIAALGQRDAGAHVAWALVRIWQRLRAVGLGEEGVSEDLDGAGPASWVPLPFRQEDLADALGLSLVHTNKTLARLRARSLADWSDGRLRVPDLQALAGVATMEVDPLDRRPLM